MVYVVDITIRLFSTRQAKQVIDQKGCGLLINTPLNAAFFTLSVTAMSVSAGLRSGPAAFKDSAPARSSIRSVPRSLAHVVCCRRRRRWRGHLSRQKYR